MALGVEVGVKVDPEKVRLGMPYRCWVSTSIGKLQGRFVPVQRVGHTAWGPVFLGNVYITNGHSRRIGDAWTNARYFADELEPWES